MISLTPGGTLRYFYNTYNNSNIFETWNIAYSCDYSNLVQAGSLAIWEEQVSLVTSTNGNLFGYTTNTTIGEIYAGCIAPNGN